MTDEQKKKVNWLSRAEANEDYIAVLKLQIAREKDAALLLLEPELIQKVEDSIQEQTEKTAELVDVRYEIRKAISSIHDPELEAILVRRYLLYETVPEIARQMFFTVRTVQRKHLKALEKITIPQFGGCL